METCFSSVCLIFLFFWGVLPWIGYCRHLLGGISTHFPSVKWVEIPHVTRMVTWISNHSMVSSKWGKYRIWMNYPFKATLQPCREHFVSFFLSLTAGQKAVFLNCRRNYFHVAQSHALPALQQLFATFPLGERFLGQLNHGFVKASLVPHIGQTSASQQT